MLSELQPHWRTTPAYLGVLFGFGPNTINLIFSKLGIAPSVIFFETGLFPALEQSDVRSYIMNIYPKLFFVKAGYPQIKQAYRLFYKMKY